MCKGYIYLKIPKKYLKNTKKIPKKYQKNYKKN